MPNAMSKMPGGGKLEPIVHCREQDICAVRQPTSYTAVEGVWHQGAGDGDPGGGAGGGAAGEKGP